MSVQTSFELITKTASDKKKQSTLSASCLKYIFLHTYLLYGLITQLTSLGWTASYYLHLHFTVWCYILFFWNTTRLRTRVLKIIFNQLQEMQGIRNWMIQSDIHIDCNCFSLNIMAHGDRDGWLMDRHGRKSWFIDQIVRDLGLVETLVGKPKLVLL